jgi:hypothetical protein
MPNLHALLSAGPWKNWNRINFVGTDVDYFSEV